LGAVCALIIVGWRAFGACSIHVEDLDGVFLQLQNNGTVSGAEDFTVYVDGGRVYFRFGRWSRVH
jgi:hypothetical protein